MSCRERARLLEQYSDAESNYSESTKAMQGLFGPEFWQARQRFEQDRMAWQEALTSLESHERNHGCIAAAALDQRLAPPSRRSAGRA